jgi:N-acetylglucosaminyl-diphospho-decaprenol L-rhamnosyltransferase
VLVCGTHPWAVSPVSRHGEFGVSAQCVAFLTTGNAPIRLSSPAVGGLRCYGDEMAVVTVGRRGAEISTPGATESLRLTEELGRPAVVNRAIAGLDARIGWVAVLDPGFAFAPGALDVLRAAAGPRAGLLGPLLRGSSRIRLPTCGPLPNLGALLRGRVPAIPVVAGPIGWLDGRCVLVRRLAWDSVDGYDSRHAGTGTQPEPADIDLGDRLGRAGWLVVGVPESEAVVHPVEGQGILDIRGPESRGEGLRRYVHDRYRAPARTLMALVRRG